MDSSRYVVVDRCFGRGMVSLELFKLKRLAENTESVGAKTVVG